MCLSHGHGDCKIIMIKGGGGCWMDEDRRRTSPALLNQNGPSDPHAFGAIKCGSESDETNCSSWLLQLLLAKIRDVVAFMATKTGTVRQR